MQIDEIVDEALAAIDGTSALYAASAGAKWVDEQKTSISAAEVRLETRLVSCRRCSAIIQQLREFTNTAVMDAALLRH
jgi:hypothetical protein